MQIKLANWTKNELMGNTQTKADTVKRKPKGSQVGRTIKNYYVKKRGYSKEHAAKIAGAVAGEEHRGD